MPQCNRNLNRPPAPVRPEYGEQCGPLSDRNGIWKCDSKTCYLHCNHGYIATDFGEFLKYFLQKSHFLTENWSKLAIFPLEIGLLSLSKGIMSYYRLKYAPLSMHYLKCASF